MRITPEQPRRPGGRRDQPEQHPEGRCLAGAVRAEVAENVAGLDGEVDVVDCGQLAGRPFSLALDCHSGYGFDDSLWFPYAKTRRLMAHLPEMFALKTMLEQSMPHHGYSFEPQSNQYLLHGDLWDHAYDHGPASHVFLPMTLELGSWLWIRKNPRQLFSRNGIFNPIKAHRTKRVLRRHADLLDFLTRAAFAAPRWLPQAERRAQLQQLATAHWRPRRVP